MATIERTDTRPCTMKWIEQEEDVRARGWVHYKSEERRARNADIPLAGLLLMENPAYDEHVRDYLMQPMRDEAVDNQVISEIPCYTVALVLRKNLSAATLRHVVLRKNLFTRMYSDYLDTFILVRHTSYQRSLWGTGISAATLRSGLSNSYTDVVFHEEDGDALRVWIHPSVSDVENRPASSIVTAVLSEIDITILFTPVGVTSDPLYITRESMHWLAALRGSMDWFDHVRDNHLSEDPAPVMVKGGTTLAKTFPIKVPMSVRNAAKVTGKRGRKTRKLHTRRRRSVDLDVDKHGFDQVHIDSRFIERMTLPRAGQGNNSKSLMVIGLTPSLSPVPFWDTAEDRLQNDEDSRYEATLRDTEYFSEFQHHLNVSWLTPASRIYVHRAQDAFRFMFALEVHALMTRNNTRRLEKRPLMVCFTYSVPMKGINVSYQGRWRGMGAQLSKAVNSVPGLGMALTAALNEAKVQAAKWDGTTTNFLNLINKTPLPYGHTYAFPGWGRAEIEAMDNVMQDEHWRQWYGYGQPRSSVRKDGPFGWHRARARSYRKRSIPFIRVLDVAKNVFGSLDENLIGCMDDRRCNQLQQTARAISLEDDGQACLASQYLSQGYGTSPRSVELE